jgi:hypothetical protein
MRGDTASTQQRTQDLATGARWLLHLLRERAVDGVVQVGQKELAKVIGADSRTIRRWLTQLINGTFLISERVGLAQANHYRLVSAQERTTVSAQERTTVSAQERTTVSAQERTTVSAPIAAAAVFEFKKGSSTPHEVAAAAAALKSVGVVGHVAEELAAQDPQLAAVAAPWLQEVFSAPRKRRIDNHTGFAKWALQSPGENGFTRDATGAWQRPPPERRAAIEQMAAAARETRRREAAAEEVRLKLLQEAEQKRWSDLSDRWDALREAEREAIRASVRRELPIANSSDPEAYVFKQACLRFLEVGSAYVAQGASDCARTDDAGSPRRR